MERLRKRIVFLWVFVMVGFTLHNVVDVMPIFWGANVAIDASGAVPQGLLLLMMMFSFLIPGVGCLCILYGTRRWMQWLNVVLATVVMLFNFVHSIELADADNWGQFVVLPMMDILGVLLWVDSIRLLRNRENQYV